MEHSIINLVGNLKNNCIKKCEYLFSAIIQTEFSETQLFPVFLIINHYLLKAEGHYYYKLNCWERKKKEEYRNIFSYFSQKIGVTFHANYIPWRPFA